MKASLAVACIAMLVMPASPVDADEHPGRVVIIAAEGVDPVELIGAQDKRGRATGLLSVRTGARADQRLASEAAVATMLRGIRSTTFEGETPDLVAEAAREGMPLIVLRGPASVAVPGAIEEVSQQMRGAEELGRSLSGALERSRFVLVMLGPTTSDALERATSVIEGLSDASDTVIVVSIVPAARDFSDRLWLGAMTIGRGSGVLTSDTTGIPGVISLLDVVPTVARELGLPEPSSDGQAVHTSDEGVDLSEMAARFRHSTKVRHPLTRGMLWAAMAGLGLSAILLARSMRRLPTFLSGALLATPVGMIAEPVSGARSLAQSVLFVLVVASFGGLAVALRPVKGCLSIALVTLAVVMGDLLVGEPLSRYSVLSYSPIQGDRFHGMGNEMMGVAIGSVLVVAALVPDRWRTSLIVLMAAVTGIMAAPTLGAKLGAVLTCTPAFLATLVARQRRPGPKAWLAIAGLTAAATVMIGAISAVSDTPGHVGEVAGGGTDLVDVLLRKAGAAGRILRFSIWPRALVAVTVIFLLARRYVPPVGAALLGAGPRASAYGAGVAVVAAFAFNDAGAIAAALLAVVCTAGLLASCVEIQRPRSS